MSAHPGRGQTADTFWPRGPCALDPDRSLILPHSLLIALSLTLLLADSLTIFQSVLPGPQFFRGVDWNSLRRDGAAPFRPRISSSLDTSHFDQFEERSWPSSETKAEGPKREEDLVFSDYTFKRFDRATSDALLQGLGSDGDGRRGGLRIDAGDMGAATDAGSPASPPARQERLPFRVDLS